MKLPPNKRWLIAVILMLIFAVFMVFMLGKIHTADLSDNGGDVGLIRLSEVSLVQDRGRIFLDATVDIDLPLTIRAGLDSGVPLVFVLTMKFVEPSQYWFDKQLELIEHRYTLTYYELTRHYRVKSLATNAHRNYRSLSSALRGLGAIEGLPLILEKTPLLLRESDMIFQNENKGVVAVMDFRLDSRSLPLPLQPVITSNWRLASKELMWPVN